jgi:hypothetical protein
LPTIPYVLVTIRLLRVTNKAAVAATNSATNACESLEISQRVQVSIEGVAFGQGGRIDYVLRNSGRMSETQVGIQVSLEKKADLKAPEGWKVIIKPDPMGISVAPGEVSPQSYPSAIMLDLTNGLPCVIFKAWTRQ